MNKKELKAILALCVDVSCDTLRLSVDYNSKHSAVSTHYRIGDDEKLHQLFAVETRFTKAEKELNKLIDWHDELYSPENIEATKEAARLAKIAELQKQIEELS